MLGRECALSLIRYMDLWIVLCTVVSGGHDLLLWFVLPNKKDWSDINTYLNIINTSKMRMERRDYDIPEDTTHAVVVYSMYRIFWNIIIPSLHPHF